MLFENFDHVASSKSIPLEFMLTADFIQIPYDLLSRNLTENRVKMYQDLSRHQGLAWYNILSNPKLFENAVTNLRRYLKLHRAVDNHVSLPRRTSDARAVTRATRNISCCTAAHFVAFRASLLLPVAS